MVRSVLAPTSADRRGTDKLVATAVPHDGDNGLDVSNFPSTNNSEAKKPQRASVWGVTVLATRLRSVGCAMVRTKQAEQTEACFIDLHGLRILHRLILRKTKGSFPACSKRTALSASGHRCSRWYVMCAMPSLEITAFRNALFDLYRAHRHHLSPIGKCQPRSNRYLPMPIHSASFAKHTPQPKKKSLTTPVQMWRDSEGDTPLPRLFRQPPTLAPWTTSNAGRGARSWVDSSISKTINCRDISFDAFQGCSICGGGDQGCKGCTTYRPQRCHRNSGFCPL